ncbi:MAG: transglutaminase-like domain-containing protein [Pegethrix bostrychoides GSE-TBD4-15B]|jgi:regulator of sirC expression with transglutaminase-like and TPR domain|uniref:Transglutaminase-like domain-containing protein n=1 Tax=Pegethrix bostrychoides GSE-TBD4-15B TaxID=2839662 RepID=A0A951PFU0_9CYAN|nr:transglutaminase-like domain-containing protein [Pegethrix bostrychoides GSE-TBD4-15B]
MNFSTASQRFYAEIHQPQINLARAALYLAQAEYPQLQVEVYLEQLDSMAAEVATRLPAAAYPLRIIQALNQYLFKDLGFHGNSGQYYDPRNSYLNSVLDRRMGIPITLSLVYLEIAQRIGFPMVGINMPGHFLIRPLVAEMQLFVDPFHQGEVLFVEDCEERLGQIFGRPVTFRPEFAAAVSPQQFLARMLGNLKQIYTSQNEPARAIAVIDRLLLLFPDSLPDQRDRGLMHYRLGQWTSARRDLKQYLTQAPSARDADSIRTLLQRLQNAEAE